MSSITSFICTAPLPFLLLAEGSPIVAHPPASRQPYDLVAVPALLAELRDLLAVAPGLVVVARVPSLLVLALDRPGRRGMAPLLASKIGPQLPMVLLAMEQRTLPFPQHPGRPANVQVYLPEVMPAALELDELVALPVLLEDVLAAAMVPPVPLPASIV